MWGGGEGKHRGEGKTRHKIMMSEELDIRSGDEPKLFPQIVKEEGEGVGGALQ